jgi:D-beta-D-heptose 7-phosphate kinase/D-beta-D-heptose 1-phosphate adenosyltransferase
MRRRRVLVVGDVMLDEFLWGRVSRISPEATVPLVRVERESFHVGGAGNVAANVRGLGGEAVLVGVLGADAAGARVGEAVAEAGIEARLVADRARPTTVKTRIVAHHQQVVRADRERTDDLPAEIEDALLERIREALPSCRAVVVSDYQKGVVTARVMKSLRGLATRQDVPVLVDPKVRHLERYRGATVVTPNQAEAEQATGVRIRGEADLREAGEKILRRLDCDAALITRGEHGMSLFPRGGKPLHIPTAAREVFDVTGAGDTVVGTLALALAAGAALPEAAVLANFAAGVVVGKLGTATANPDELLGALEAGLRA